MDRCIFCASFKFKLRAWLWVILPLAVIPILGGWVGDIFKDWWINPEGVSVGALVMLFVSLILLIALATLIVWQGKKLLPSRVVEQTRNLHQRKVVIALLSPCNTLKYMDEAWQVQNDKDRLWHSAAGKTLEDLVSTSSGLPRWSWQQTLRTANYHRNRLERLILLGSRGTHGSGTEQQLRMARQFFESLFPGKVFLPSEPKIEQDKHDQRWTVDFEDLDALMKLLRDVIRTVLDDRAGYQETDIAIDCTGGFKVTSIAAAMVTLDHPDIVFQYVNNDGQVISFNAVSEGYGS